MPEGLRTHKERMKRFIAAKQRLEKEQKERANAKEEEIAIREKERNRVGKRKEVGNQNNPERLLKAGLWQM